MMSTITLSVDAVTADAYAAASPKVKREIQDFVAGIFSDERLKNARADLPRILAKVRQEAVAKGGIDDLTVIMDRIAAEAQSNGMTPEVFEKLLTDG